jgi:hypothetical protein
VELNHRKSFTTKAQSQKISTQRGNPSRLAEGTSPHAGKDQHKDTQRKQRRKRRKEKSSEEENTKGTKKTTDPPTLCSLRVLCLLPSDLFLVFFVCLCVETLLFSLLTPAAS